MYIYKKLPIGVTDASARAKSIEIVFNVINNGIVNQDDIPIIGAKNLQTLSQVYTRLEEYGLKVNLDKMYFLATLCNLLWSSHHRTWSLAGGSLNQSDNRSNKIGKRERTRSFLGLINYSHRFVPNISCILCPLYELKMDNATWKWSERHKNAFVQAKIKIASDRVLAHYDPNLPLHEQCDAGPNGQGVVMSHHATSCQTTQKDRSFSYRAHWNQPERTSHIQKEALAIVWGKGVKDCIVIDMDDSAT